MDVLEKDESKSGGNAALYARVSSREAQNRQDPENQLIRLRAYADARDLEIYKEYIDHASGANPNRPALSEMLEAAHRKEFDSILIVRLDRIMRSTMHLLEVVEILDFSRVSLICLDQPIDTRSSTGRLTLSILGAIAEFERDLIRERTLDGLARSKKKSGRPPRDDIDLKRAFALRREGNTWREIARTLGVPHSTLTDRVRKRGGV